MENPTNSRKQLEQCNVVGHFKDGHCCLLPESEGNSANDQNLGAARRFVSLSEAISVSEGLAGNVFEVIVADDGRKLITELRVDLHKLEEAPYRGCYCLVNGLLIGPTPVWAAFDETQNRINALRQAGVHCVVSLLSRDELFWSHEEDDEEWLESFEHHVFPIRDGGTPTEPAMQLILNVIDSGYHDTRSLSFIAGAEGAVPG